jgi:hypothetical protein
LVTLGLIITLTMTAAVAPAAAAAAPPTLAQAREGSRDTFREGSLTGKVTDATGAVIVGASVSAVQSAASLRRDVATAADGTFVIERIAASARPRSRR